MLFTVPHPEPKHYLCSKKYFASPVSCRCFSVPPIGDSFAVLTELAFRSKILRPRNGAIRKMWRGKLSCQAEAHPARLW